jgi:hypothetical protein
MSWGKGTKATYETRCVSLHSIRNLDPLLDNERPSPTWANGGELWKSDGTAAGTERSIAACDLAKQAQGPTQRVRLWQIVRGPTHLMKLTYFVYDRPVGIASGKRGKGG